jgi:uncharacterized protein YecE (DUF72 family)
MSQLRIGTSGWSYQSWRGPFFPFDLPAKDHLAFYATRFNATELNAPFYRTPTLDAVKRWRDSTPTTSPSPGRPRSSLRTGSA